MIVLEKTTIEGILAAGGVERCEGLVFLRANPKATFAEFYKWSPEMAIGTASLLPVFRKEAQKMIEKESEAWLWRRAFRLGNLCKDKKIRKWAKKIGDDILTDLEGDKAREFMESASWKTAEGW